jgi:lysophospholipase L1-like esterase
MAALHRKVAIAALFVSCFALTGCLATPTIGRDFNQSVVFIGDSITARWDLEDYFGRPFINKGIESQTAEQIAARFQSDVIDLHPDVVVILAGTNDVRAESDLSQAHNSVAEMVRLANANGIRPIVCTIPPLIGHLATARNYNSLLTNDPVLQISCDYYRVLTDENGNPIPGVLDDDGLHPSVFGYVRMAKEINGVLNNQRQ